MKIITIILLIMFVLGETSLLVFGILATRNFVKFYDTEDLIKSATCFVFLFILAAASLLMVLAFNL